MPIIPLLLTSSVVAHDKGVSLKDTDARIHHAVEAIERWLAIDPKLPIVICDGSSYDFSKEMQARFPSTNIECLYFENDQHLVRQFGRGYGEGEIVKFAIQHSQTIEKYGCFAKCTSKLWVDNFNACLSFWNGKLLCKGVFLDAFSPLKKINLNYIDTRFYISSTDFYKKYLLDAHQDINVSKGYGLEECFRDVLILSKLHHVLMPIYPIIGGVGGGTGEYYRNPARRLIKEKLRLLIARRSTEFKELFSN
nr:hypothetical protein [uncultured Rhodoferax sp.]